jgi:hypothetical protein
VKKRSGNKHDISNFRSHSHASRARARYGPFALGKGQSSTTSKSQHSHYTPFLVIVLVPRVPPRRTEWTEFRTPLCIVAAFELYCTPSAPHATMGRAELIRSPGVECQKNSVFLTSDEFCSFQLDVSQVGVTNPRTNIVSHIWIP